jgi:trk system potassium uptake protein TrkA
MNIVILGAGKIGSYLATVLSREEHNVIVIDQNPKPLEKISRSADVATRVGSGTDWQVLEEFVDQQPQLFIAVSSDDETNLIACAIAKNLGYPKTVARIRDSNYLNQSRLDFGRLFFVDHFIGMELIVAHDILRWILHPGTMTIENFAHGAVQLRTVTIPPDWKGVNQKISELDFHKNLLVGLIRGEGKRLIFPRGSDKILAGDEVTLIGDTKLMSEELPSLFGVLQKKPQSVVIAGGSSVAIHLARILQEQKISVKIIEPDEQRCYQLAEALPKATILNQDFTDLNFLITEKVGAADVFVASTTSDESNILAGALAKQAGCNQVLAIISDASCAPLLKKLGITYTVSERVSIAARIQSIIHADAVISVASLYENQAKIMEIKVSSDCRIVGTPLADLNLPPDCLIALIYNRGQVMIAKGNSILTPGDTIIVLSSPKAVNDLEKIF